MSSTDGERTPPAAGGVDAAVVCGEPDVGSQSQDSSELDMEAIDAIIAGMSDVSVDASDDFSFHPSPCASDGDADVEELSSDMGDGLEDSDDSMAGLDLAGPSGPASPPKGPKDKADLVLDVPNGILRYYKKGNIVVAHCTMQGHGSKCCRTRTLTLSLKKGRSGQGRPLGLLLRWLTHLAPSEREHKTAITLFMPDRAARITSRALLVASVGADHHVFRIERPRRIDESDDEPPLAP
jgi:hypothetical protein